MRYEYYVNYLGLDRRNERWVTEHYIQIDDDEIERQEQKIKDMEQNKQKDTYMDNDENLGWDDKYVQFFKKSTKIKPVESLQIGMNWLLAWYFSPLPKEYHCKCLYVCDFCLSFFVKKKEFR